MQAEDGMIDEKEQCEFEKILAELSELEQRIEALRLWAEQFVLARKKKAA